MKREIRLSGLGGQGLLLAGECLGSAAVKDGLNAVQTETYGATARGSLAYSDVIISDEEISYPEVADLDILVAMSQEAFEKFGGDVPSDCIVILDSKNVKDGGGKNTFAVPMTDIAVERVGERAVSNIVMLGVLVAVTGLVSKGSIERAILESVPEGTEDLNIEALGEGFRAGKEGREG